MRLRGPRRQEWCTALLVVSAALATSWRISHDARELDAATERRRAQLAHLAEVSHAGVVPADGAGRLGGLFCAHEIVVAQAPWGAHLALRSDSCPARGR
jgi:hypothetical protein